MLTEEQQAIRRTGIGGSEIAAILGLSPFLTPLDVYLGKVEGWLKPMTPDMERGTYLEGGMLAWYGAREHVECIQTEGTLVDGLAVATPDALVQVRQSVRPDTMRVVEVKCPRRSFGWEQGPIEGYVLQSQWTHGVVRKSTNYAVDPTIHIVALLDGDLRIFPVEADLELQAELFEFAESWWKKHVVAKNPPPLGGDAGARAWLTRRFPTNRNPVRAATNWEDLRMLALCDAEAELSKWDEEVETIRNELRQSIGEASGIEGPAGRCTWVADKNGKRSFRTNWSLTK